MQKLWRGLFILVVLLIASISVMAIDTTEFAPQFFDSTSDILPQFNQAQPSTSADVVIVPREGEQGDLHEIAVSGLNPGETITIRIVEDATGTRVYNSSRNASGNGRVQVDIFTTSDDAPGTYTIEVLNSTGTVIGTGALVILETSGLSGTISISPETNTAGSTYSIEISNVRPFLDMEVIVLNEISERVFTTQVRATVDGEATVQYTSTPRDGGTYSVVVRAGGAEIASGALIVEGPLSIAETTLLPEAVNTGEDVIVSVTGLDSNEVITVIVTQAGNAVMTVGETADVNGNVIFLLPTDDAKAGIYGVRVISAQGVTLSQSTYTVLGGNVSFVVTPEQAPVNNMFVFAVSGIDEGETVTIQLIQNDSIVISEDLTTDVNGTAVLLLNHENGLIPGTFTARLIYDDVAVAESEIIVEPVEGLAIGTPTLVPTQAPTLQATTPAIASEPDISIEPTSGPIPTSYNITASGLTPGSNLTVQIRYAGNVIYAVDGLAANDGTFTTRIVSEESDPVGAYTLELVQNGAAVDTVAFSIDTGSAAQAQPTPAATGNVTINIVPPNVTLGATFDIRVDGLVPNSEAVIQIVYQNSAVYTTTRIADTNGMIIVNLQTDGTEDPGTYAVTVQQDNTAIATQNFNIGQNSTQPAATPPPATSTASIAINPPTGTIGTDHIITVSGLNPNETVAFEILFGGNTVFESERTADNNGTFEIGITSESGDPSGVYDVRVLRGDQAIATSQMTVTETSALQPQPTQPPASSGAATVNINPPSGAIGTSHTITVNGLTPNTDVTLEVRFNGSAVYSTTRTSDATGAVVLNLSSEAGDPEGTYTVVVIADGSQLATGDFVVGSGSTSQPQPTQIQPTPSPQIQPTQPPASSGTATVSINPPNGAIGTSHTVTVNGLTPNTNVTLEVRFNGSAVYSTTRTSDATGAVVLNLSSEAGDPEGTYTVAVIADGSQLATGDFVVGSGSAVQPQPTQVQPTPSTQIQPTQPPASSGGVTVTIDPPLGAIGTVHNITVNGLETNETVTLDVTFAGASVFSTSRVADAQGSLVLTLNSEEGDSEGQYTVTVLRNDAAIGSAFFNVGAATTTTPQPTQPPVSSGGNIGAAESISGNLSATEPVYRYNFDGQAGETVLISQDSVDFDTYLVLQDNAGNELISNDDSANTVNSQIGPYTLPYSGSYTIVAGSFAYWNSGEVATGQFNLRVEHVTVANTSYGTTSTLNITPDNSAQILAFDAQAGDVISVSVDSNIDTRLTITGPDGLTVFADDDGGLGFNPEVPRYVIPAAGRYALMISSFSSSDTGSVQLTLNRDDVRSLDTDIRTVRLNSKQTSDTLTLQGVSGSRINLNVSLLNGEVGNLTITVIQGAETLMFYQTSGMPQDIALGFEVGTDSAVNIIIEDLNTSGATLEFSITHTGQ